MIFADSGKFLIGFIVSSHWVSAKISAFAGFAMLAHPNFVELVHCLFNDFGVIGQDTGFKISTMVGFHTDARPCKICAAYIYFLTIENKHFEMYTRAQHSFQTVVKHGIFIKILAKVLPRLLCVNKPHLYTSLNKLGNQPQKRLLLLARIHIKVFDVGSTNPKSALHVEATREDAVVVVGVGDVGEHNIMIEDLYIL